MGFPTQENREIRLSGGRENDLVPSTVARWYDFCEPGGYQGMSALDLLFEAVRQEMVHQTKMISQ